MRRSIRHIGSFSRPLRNTLLAGLFSLAPSLALAAAPGHGGHGGAHGIESLIPYWINFLVYVGILALLLRKPLGRAWQARREGVEAAMGAAGAELVAAETKLAAARARMDRVYDEIAAVESGLRREITQEVQQINELAAARAQQLRQVAQQMAEAERRAALQSVRGHVAGLIVDSAGDQLRRELTVEQDKKLREAAVQRAARLLGSR